MKVGSILKCIDDNFRNHEGEIYPVRNAYYTVRGIRPSTKIPGDVAFLLEEIINKPRIYNTGYTELAFNQRHFREIQFPPSLEAEIKECLTREFQER